VIYLDTHAVVWLYDDTDKKFSNKAKEEIRNNDLSISQMVRLELQYLYEIGRIKTHLCIY
jgi:PIN domain nuclease of toxin-antitoxin system